VLCAWDTYSVKLCGMLPVHSVWLCCVLAALSFVQRLCVRFFFFCGAELAPCWSLCLHASLSCRKKGGKFPGRVCMSKAGRGAEHCLAAAATTHVCAVSVLRMSLIGSVDAV
jgi:hypothetical protein